MRDQRILITGGAGLVGSYITDLLALEQAAEIVVFDNFVRGQPAEPGHGHGSTPKGTEYVAQQIAANRNC